MSKKLSAAKSKSKLLTGNCPGRELEGPTIRRISPVKLVEIGEHSAAVILYALAQRLKIVQAELCVLKLTTFRELTLTERWELPVNLQEKSRQELEKEIDPWITLVQTIQALIEEFSFDEP